jgi:hypothetical protein
MVTYQEIRTRLESVSLDDIDAVHALYLDGKNLKVNLTHRGNLDAVETVRRVERALGTAIRAAQARGEMLAKNATNTAAFKGRMVRELFSTSSEADHLYALVDGISDEQFEEAIRKCRANGGLSREKLEVQLKERQADTPPPPPPPAVHRVLPTRRGRKTIEHMAISLNALALGVAELDPGEVDKAAMLPMINQAFEDIGVIRTFLRKVNKQ